MKAWIYQHGERYARIEPDGRVTRLDGTFGPSEKWRITGAVRRNNFGSAVEWFSLRDVLDTDIRWTHENGAQRVYLTDLDHGTGRTWGPGHRVMRLGD